MDDTTIPVTETASENPDEFPTAKVTTTISTPEFPSPNIPIDVSKEDSNTSTLEVPIDVSTPEASAELLTPKVSEPSRFSREKMKENFILLGRKLLVLAFSYVGLTCMVICYSLLGAVLFHALESWNEEATVMQISQERQKRLKELWEITRKLNILEEKDWIRQATDVIKDFERSIYKATSDLGWDGHTEEASGELNWSFTGSLLYSVTVITTIGYGHITPKTWAGRLITIIYALIGIPLTLLCLANIGKIWGKSFKLLYSKIPPVNKQLKSHTLTKQEHIYQRNDGYCDVSDGECSRAKEIGDPTNREQSNMVVISHEHLSKSGKCDVISHKQLRQSGKCDGISHQQLRQSGKCDGISHEQLSKSGESDVMGQEHLIQRRHCDVINQGHSIMTNDTQELNDKEHEKKLKEIKNVQVPIIVCILLVAVYILIGVLIFTFWERKWNILTSAYFCFITLSTIGFGDFVPGHSSESWSNQPKQIICTLYLLFGLALLAMCFDLIQDQVRSVATKIGVFIKLLKRE